MEAVSQWALTSLTTYGVPMLIFIAFIGSLGIPFPITLVIVAAGAFARTGALDWRLALLACVVGAALADHSEYLLGRLAQPWLKRRYADNVAWQKAQSIINRQGVWAILLTRFWLTPLAPAVNVIAGSRYPLVRFMFLDLLGQLIWVLLYGGLGFFFAAEWEAMSRAASLFSAVSIALFFATLVVIFLARRTQSRPTALPGATRKDVTI